MNIWIILLFLIASILIGVSVYFFGKTDVADNTSEKVGASFAAAFGILFAIGGMYLMWKSGVSKQVSMDAPLHK